MTRPARERDPFKIGVVALVVAALVGVGVVLLSTLSFGTTTYTAVLEHTAGLRAGEDVQVHGVLRRRGAVGRARRGRRRGAVHPRLRDPARQADHRRGQGGDPARAPTTSRSTRRARAAWPTRTIPLERTSGALQPPGRARAGHLGPRPARPRPAGSGADRDQRRARRLRARRSARRSRASPGSPSVISARSDQTGRLLRAARGVSDQLNAGSDDLFALMKLGQPRDRGGGPPARGDPPAARGDPRAGRRARLDRAADPRRPRPRAARPQHGAGLAAQAGPAAAGRARPDGAGGAVRRQRDRQRPLPRPVPQQPGPSRPTTASARWGTADEDPVRTRLWSPCSSPVSRW